MTVNKGKGALCRKAVSGQKDALCRKDVPEQKDALRLSMREKRRALSAEEVQIMSARICENLFSIPEFMRPNPNCPRLETPRAHAVCAYISAFKEPDTLGIIRALRERGVSVAAPITDMETGTLSLAYITDLDALKKGAYGILEPSMGNTADATDIDAVLVPGLAFDRSGARLGFGKGYYDRLLSDMRCVKIGLCYDFQLFDKIPSDTHDAVMDFIVTEKEILRL